MLLQCICSFYFSCRDKSISVTPWKSTGSSSLFLWSEKVKRIWQFESVMFATKPIICSHSRARMKSLIASRQPPFLIGSKENACKIANPCHCNLAEEFLRQHHFLTQRHTERSSVIYKQEIYRLSGGQYGRKNFTNQKTTGICFLSTGKATASFSLFYIFHVEQTSKPLLERQRRARINRSLEELKGLVLSALYRDVSILCSIWSI